MCVILVSLAIGHAYTTITRMSMYCMIPLQYILPVINIMYVVTVIQVCIILGMYCEHACHLNSSKGNRP